MDIKHVVVLMLENRSFDSMLGMLSPHSETFDGLTGSERNIWHKADGPVPIPVWKSAAMTPDAACIPTPDPGELFTDIHMQIHGVGDPAVAMGGFVDNYMQQPAKDGPHDPAAVMHYFTPDEIPVLSQLARAFGVSDRWHASAPCQTWPNRFFAHTATANGYVNNSPTHFPYLMETVFNRLEDDAKVPWRVYFHDFPQSATLARLWGRAACFRHFNDEFIRDAASGSLPAYSFIEPRYFANPVLQTMPNDQHPPHNIAYGEALIASVYNAVRHGPGWRNTLLIITYDEHGGCYDHVVPPAATPPGGQTPNGFDFSSFGVRVPAVIVSPWVPKGSVIRPTGATPFDHTSIIATLRQLFPFRSLTPRDAAAPDLMHALSGDGTNDGPASIVAAEPTPTTAELTAAAAAAPNGMQTALSTAALQLPTAGANVDTHVKRLAAVPDTAPNQPTVGAAVADAVNHVKAFLALL
ncbi:alkaline phosphatase family protein [Acidisphaera sp. S103]|uniref:alkaline phosphatase family protein n=1 Tax=Acidisphaera sp. S103 TaxID=1747223 RepID=UPI00131A94B6|nr:alkaline phosphatase family protein [Acidisphaera sp. S103]